NLTETKILPIGFRPILRMKKLLLFAVAIIGTASASQAGVRFNINLGAGAPTTCDPVISRPVPGCETAPVTCAAPVYQQSAPAVCAPAPAVCERPITVP